MATAARFNTRKVAPKAAAKAEAPATTTPVKASFLSRAKAVVVKTASRVAAFVKVQARKVALVARVAVARSKPIAKRAWTVALRPFLGGVLAGTSLGVLVISSLVAPVATVLTLLVTGGLFVLFARLVKQLEEVETVSRFARVTLGVLEFIAQTLRALAYVGAVLITAALCVTSLPFAIFTMLALAFAYYDVRGGSTIAFLVWCVLSGSWGFGLLWLMWRGARRTYKSSADTDVVTDVPAYSEIRIRPPVVHAHVLRADSVAVGTEEVTHLYAEADAVLAEMMEASVENAQACDACGTTKGALRIRSNAVPFATVGAGFGKSHETSDAMLCTDCYDAECEDNAIALTGVSLRKRSVNVVLNVVGRASLSEVVASKADTTQLFWAVTAWWRDRKGHHHDRQWDCFHAGQSVATVTYDHARKVYRASANGKFLGTKTGLSVAQRLAADTFNDAYYGEPDPRPNSPQHAEALGLLAKGETS